MPDSENGAASAVAEAVAAPKPAPDPVQSAIDAWVDAHIRNSPVSRATEAWNHLISSLPALAAALKKDPVQ